MMKFKLKDALLPVGILIFGLIITVLPWTFRNYKIYKAFAPVTIESGRILYLGNNPRATGGTGGWYKYGQDQFLPDNVANPHSLEANRKMLKEAMGYIVSHPRRTIILDLGKFVNMWRPFYAKAQLVNKVIMSLLYIPIIILAVVGMIKTGFGNFKKYSLLHFLIFYFVIVYMVTLSVIRYRYPVMPYIIIFSSYSILFLFDKNRQQGELSR